MAKSACKCKKAAECEECPEWIFTFADLVMLMMGFFVILWVLKPSPTQNPAESSRQRPPSAAEDRWLDAVESIRDAFGYVPNPDSKDPVAQHALAKMRGQETPDKGPGKPGATKEPPQGPDGTDPLVMNVRPGTHVSVGGKLLFEGGDAALSPQTTKALDEIVQLVKGHRQLIQVKGHAAPDDIRDKPGMSELARGEQQMGLSIRRAQAAAAYLIAQGLSPDVVRVQGCSIFEPVVQKVYTAQAQALNRRVEVEVTDTLVEDRQDREAPTTAPAVD